jgi:hypothetical protein
VVVVNDISRPEIGFDVSDNEVTILAADGARREVSRAVSQGALHVRNDCGERASGGPHRPPAAARAAR